MEISSLIAKVCALWRPPPKLTGSQWADRNFYLSAESAAEPGPWRTLPYQVEPLDCMTDAVTERVSWMKSARVGYTKLVGATIGFFVDNDPCPMMVVQPTIEDAEDYSKDEIAPMIRDCPVLEKRFRPARAKDGDNTIIKKNFPGGSLSMVGANSPRGFRRVSRRVVIFDETDGYPPSAGAEGDQLKLGMKRAESYWNRKIIMGSTPTEERVSRILEAFNDGDQRRYFVPCPECGHKQTIKFANFDWNWSGVKDPWTAKLRCENPDAPPHLIDHSSKRWMIANGEWRAEKPFKGHASFHIWTAYSLSPNATWGHIAAEFEDANRKGPEALKTFVMTTLGECWKDKGEAPDWQVLFNRREAYKIGTVPAGGMLLTCGVDVQKDRLVFEVVAWGRDFESWSIDAGVLMGNTAESDVWASLSMLLDRVFKHENGADMRIACMGVDSGYNTNTVYGWCRHYPKQRVLAVKGNPTGSALVTVPTKVDVSVRGKRLARGYQVWPAAVNIAKSELYGWLGQEQPDESVGEVAFPGFCHFPEFGEEYFKELTAEQLIQRKNKKGYTVHEWVKIPNREKHFLDCRIYARVAAAVCGVDRFGEAEWDLLSRNLSKPGAPPPPPKPATTTTEPTAPARGRSMGTRRGSDWYKPKR